MRYSIKAKDRIYVKGYGFLSIAKNIGTQLNSRYGQKLLYRAKISTTDAIKTALKTAIQKTAEVTGDLIGNKISSVSKKSSAKLWSQNNEANDESEAPAERYISLEKIQQIIDESRLV